MKKSDTRILADKLLAQIFDTKTLKQVSIELENLAADKHLKSHALNIINDTAINSTQKRLQLSYLLSSLDNQLIQNFLTDEVGTEKLWIFDTDKIDYLDEFVQIFQQTTEAVQVLTLTAAVELTQAQIKTISRDLTEELGAKIILKCQVNPSLIGGIQVKLENYVFDFSLRTKFQQFQREWLASLEKTSKLVGRYDPTV